LEKGKEEGKHRSKTLHGMERGQGAPQQMRTFDALPGNNNRAWKIGSVNFKSIEKTI